MRGLAATRCKWLRISGLRESEKISESGRIFPAPQARNDGARSNDERAGSMAHERGGQRSSHGARERIGQPLRRVYRRLVCVLFRGCLRPVAAMVSLCRTNDADALGPSVAALFEPYFHRVYTPAKGVSATPGGSPPIARAPSYLPIRSF